MRRLVGGTPKVAENCRSCRVEAPSRFMPGNQWAPLLASERDLERERGAIISASVSSGFAKLRAAVLPRRKNTVLGRQLPLDVALRFAAPFVAWLHASVYVQGKLSAFWCWPRLSHNRETSFRDHRKQLTRAEYPQQERLGQVWPLCTHCTAAWCECSSMISRSHATKWRHIAIHAKEAFTADVNAP